MAKVSKSLEVIAQDLSIIIVNWNTRDYLQRCLQTVRLEMNYAKPGSFEVFVIDNASDDGSQEMVREGYPFVTLIENDRNVGFAAANNQGINASKGEVVLLLNSDTELHAGALSTLIDFMLQRPDVGAAGARLLNSDGSLQHACYPMLTPEREFWRLCHLDRRWPRATYAMEKWDTYSPRKVDVIKGACFLLRREALDQVGLLDERYYMYTEEVDLSYRLSEAGWELWYVPEAMVTHYGGASSEQIAESMFIHLYRSKVQFYCKMGGKWRGRWFKSLVTLAYIVRAVIQPRERKYFRLLMKLPGM